MAGAEQHDYLVLYGSLKRGFPNRSELGIEDSVEYEGPCAFEGTLFDLGDFPGACPGGGIVRGELSSARGFGHIRPSSLTHG